MWNKHSIKKIILDFPVPNQDGIRVIWKIIMYGIVEVKETVNDPTPTVSSMLLKGTQRSHHLDILVKLGLIIMYDPHWQVHC